MSNSKNIAIKASEIMKTCCGTTLDVAPCELVKRIKELEAENAELIKGRVFNSEYTSKKVNEFTHDDIADWCAARLKGLGYRFGFSNLTSAIHGEQPDVLGLDSWGNSIVVEVKVSRSDFFADKKKPWRANPEQGMGCFKVYLAPEGLLKVEDIPYGWQLWEVYGKNKPMLRIVKGKAMELVTDPHSSQGNKVKRPVYKNIDLEEYFHFRNKDKQYNPELSWILKFIGRAEDSGINMNNFANKYQD